MKNNPLTAGLPEMWSRLTQISLSNCILLSLILGLVVGLFFGEMVRPLDFIGKAFIKLMQMAVLPYIMISLILSLGSLPKSHARLIATKGYKLLVFLLGVGLAVIYTIPLAFPLVETSAFFSEADILPPKKMDFLDIFIPTNIFESLSKGTIPAIVLFSVFLGFALNGLEKKEEFLNLFEVLAKALSRVTQMIMKTAPLGVFALTAIAAGTLTFDQLQRLQVYFASYIFGALLLTFVILPSIIICFTPFTYRQIIHCSKDALILGFATANNFIILPLISTRSLELIRNRRQEEPSTSSIVDSVLPLAYCFPGTGHILDLSFILFTAWSVNQSFGIMKHLEFAITGILTLFGSTKVGIPFLLDYLKLPASYFELYLISEVVTRKFKVLAQAMSFQAMTLIMVFLVLNKYTLSLKKIASALAANLLVLACCLLTVKVGLHYAVQNVYHEDLVLMSMEILDQIPAKVLSVPPDPKPEPGGNGEGAGDILQRIKKRGVLRVGYNPEALPFAFFNQRGELVGYDISCAHQLARDLHVTLEFVPVAGDTVKSYLEKGACDIVMSAVPITAEKLGTVNFTVPYMDMNAGFIVPDDCKEAFRKRADIRKIPGLRIAVTPGNNLAERLRIQTYFPNAHLVELAHTKDFFTHPNIAEALLTTDKIGKAWALLYPHYGVVTPQPLMFRYDLGYPIAITKGDQVFLAYLNQWIHLQQTSGVAQDQYSYWILGKTPMRQTKRWSIIRNVLHWVD